MTTPRSRTFLVTPRDGEDKHLQTVLSAIVTAGDIGALLIRAQNAEKMRARASALTIIAQDHDIAVLIEEDAKCAQETNADGVHISSDLEALRIVREILGKEMIVGVNPGPSRHTAMEVAERSVDYIAFDDNAMAKWWAPLFQVPCVSLTPSTEREAGELAAQGVEFICPGETVWQDQDAGIAMIKNYNDVFATIGR